MASLSIVPMAASTAITVAYGASCAFAISSRRLSSFSSMKILDLSYLRRRANAPSPSPRRVVVRAGRTESREVVLGARAPDFEVMFICNHCPFVIHLKKDIVKLFNFYMKWYTKTLAVGRRPYELVYHGQFDDSNPGLAITQQDLSLAIDLALICQPIPSNQKPSVGCSIKWHPGAESFVPESKLKREEKAKQKNFRSMAAKRT